MLKTENYNLNKPEATDPMRVSDFNENADKIDAALGELTAGMPKIVCGTYTGNGAASRTIELGFTPKAVYVCTREGYTYTYVSAIHRHFGGLAIADAPVKNSGNILSIVDGGFQVAYDVSRNQIYIMSNNSGTQYHYIAFG